jgi:peptide/nickel transport system substrate-binding protein
MPLRRSVAIVAAATAVFGLGACSGSSDSRKGSEAVLRIGTTGTVESLNPFTTSDSLTAEFFQAIYPHLVQYDLGTRVPVGDFATKWVTSADGKRLTFTLRRGATWSDGAPLAAADVAWTINLMIKFQEDATAAWAGAVTHMIKATAPDTATLVIDYDAQVANALALLARIPVLPRQDWAKYATGKGKQLTHQSSAPSSGHPLVSGGPFVFIKYVKGQSALFRKNPKYYGSPPHVAGFGVQFFANDDAEVAALKADEIDVATGNPSLAPTDIAPLKRAGFRITQQQSLSFDNMIINTNPKKKTHKELLDPKVREAFEYATDRAKINDIVLLGNGTPGASIIPPASGVWHDPSVKQVPFDVAAADRLLDAAGYGRGSSGVRKALGHDMSYTMLVSEDVQGGERVGQLLTQSYAKIGVQLKVRNIDDDALEAAIGNDDYRTFDLALWGWDTEYDPSYMLEGMTCDAYGDTNDSGYCDAGYDELFAQQAIATVPAARRTLVYRMQEQIANDRPYIVLYYLPVLEGWSRSWSTVPESPTGVLSYSSNSSLLTIRKTS